MFSGDAFRSGAGVRCHTDEHGPTIRRTCSRFLVLCRRIGVLNGDRVAIDGFGVTAVNNRGKTFTTGRIASGIAHLGASIEGYLMTLVRIKPRERSSRGWKCDGSLTLPV